MLRRLYMLMPKATKIFKCNIQINHSLASEQTLSSLNSLISDYFAVRLVRSVPIYIVSVEVSLFVQAFKDYSSNSTSSFYLFFQHIQNKGYRSYRIQLCVYFMACMCMQPCHVRPYGHTYYSQLKLQQGLKFELKDAYVLVIDRLVAQLDQLGLNNFLEQLITNNLIDHGGK